MHSVKPRHCSLLALNCTAHCGQTADVLHVLFNKTHTAAAAMHGQAPLGSYSFSSPSCCACSQLVMLWKRPGGNHGTHTHTSKQRAAQYDACSQLWLRDT